MMTRKDMIIYSKERSIVTKCKIQIKQMDRKCKELSKIKKMIS